MIAKRKDTFDGPLPAGNPVAVLNLVYLAKHAGKAEYLDRADKTLAILTPRIAQSAASLPITAVAIQRYLDAKTAAKPPKL